MKTARTISELWRWKKCVLLSALLVCCSSVPQRSAHSSQSLPALVVVGTELLLTTGDGRAFRSRDLRGAILRLGDVFVRIDDVETESHVQGRQVTLHRAIVVDEFGNSSELCEPDAAGERWAIPLGDTAGRVRFVCTSGAVGKCLRWGYTLDPPSSPAIHEACVRMVRADYGGDGRSFTRIGVRIEFCDLVGINPCKDDGREIEAAWAPTGAVCVASVRVDELITIDALVLRYRGLAKHVGGLTCNFASAAKDSRTRLMSRPAR